MRWTTTIGGKMVAKKLNYYAVGLRGDAHEDRWAVPQALVTEANGQKAKIVYLRFLHRNGVYPDTQDIVVKATGVACTHDVGPHVTRSPQALSDANVDELDDLPFAYEGADHGQFARDPSEA